MKGDTQYTMHIEPSEYDAAVNASYRRGVQEALQIAEETYNGCYRSNTKGDPGIRLLLLRSAANRLRGSKHQRNSRKLKKLLGVKWL